jgi:S1-C subfamily serine protease
MKYIFSLFIAGLFIITGVVTNIHAEDNVKKSIVKIYTIFNKHNYYEPWQMQGQNRRTGSGCVIEGNRILTNAHIVSDYTFIEVRKSGEAKKYPAEVEVVAHESDLAILKVNDDSFFKGIPALKIGSLAKIRDKVAVYGYPIGGDELSITEGVVSRVEHQKYTHSQAYLLTCQIDAAINPGNSGGPVVMGGKIVGVAFQAGRGENIGYMVPAPVINHFLEDIKDGAHQGTPGIGMTWQKLENPDMRRQYKMSKNQSGILVNKIFPDSPAQDILQTNDIIISMNNTNIENNGTIEFRKNERTFFGYLVQKKQLKDTITMSILRNAEIKDLRITLDKPLNYWNLVPRNQYDIQPTYYIVGGLVFEKLTLNLLQEWSSWSSRAPKNLLNYYFYGHPTKDQKEIIILLKVLADEINTGYHDWNYNVIKSVNGKNISNMNDLVAAFENNTGDFHIIEDEQGEKIILDRDKVKENNKNILDKYKVSSDRSENLK